MQKILEGVDFDFSNMTLEEVEKLRDKIREEISGINPDDKSTLADLRRTLMNLNHQILMRKLSEHKHRFKQ